MFLIFHYLSTHYKRPTLLILAMHRTPVRSEPCNWLCSPIGSQLLSKDSTRMVFKNFFVVSGDPCSTLVASIFYYNFLNKNLQPVAKYRDSLTKKRPFLLQIGASHRSVRYRTNTTPLLHSTLFLQVLSMVLYCWQL